jgi:hypothetical protein
MTNQQEYLLRQWNRKVPGHSNDQERLRNHSSSSGNVSDHRTRELDKSGIHRKQETHKMGDFALRNSTGATVGSPRLKCVVISLGIKIFARGISELSGGSTALVNKFIVLSDIFWTL